MAPELGDLHVAPHSPVSDRCVGVGVSHDIDGDFRAFDHPFWQNPPGRVVDAGVDEVVAP